MIPVMNITAWSKTAPWAEQRQVEQDLIISRAIVELFSDAFLADGLRFRGGTALNKLHFPEPLRYSDDVDLVRTTEGPIKPVLHRIREILEPWLGEAAFDQSPVSPKLIFRADAEDGGAPLRLKVEIAIWEIEAYAGPAPRLRRGQPVVRRPRRDTVLWARGNAGDKAARTAPAQQGP